MKVLSVVSGATALGLALGAMGQECGLSLQAGMKGKCAVPMQEAKSPTVVSTMDDTYANALTDKEGNLSMFAQQPLVSVAADGIMAKKKAQEWGWDLRGAGVMYGCLAAHELVDRAQYLDYVRQWADHHIGQGLQISRVEQCAPGMAMVALYEKTKDRKYLTTARQLGDYLVTRPDAKTVGSEAETALLAQQEYIDTMLITGPFLARLGELTSAYRYRDAGVQQIVSHIDYLRTKESMHNLFSKVYDFQGPKKFPYLDDGGQGWIFMQIAETADLTPSEHPQKAKLAYILSNQGCATLKVSPMVFGKAAGSLTISYSHAAYTYGAAMLLSGKI